MEEAEDPALPLYRSTASEGSVNNSVHMGQSAGGECLTRISSGPGVRRKFCEQCLNTPLPPRPVMLGVKQLFVSNNDSTIRVHLLPDMQRTCTIRCQVR